MEKSINCPKCGNELELSALMRREVVGEVTTEMRAEFERRLEQDKGAMSARLKERDDALVSAEARLLEATAKHSDLLKKERELVERQREVALDFERRLADEGERVRERAMTAAREQCGREADVLVRQKEEELASVRGKLATATAREADLLKKERIVAELERDMTLDLERRVAGETERIREREMTAAREHYGREAALQVRQKEDELVAARSKLAVASAKEADLLRKGRELDDRERELAVDVEKRVAGEAERIREREMKAAREECAREADVLVRQKEEELVATRSKLAAASAREVELLRKERGLADRERELGLDLERRLAEEIVRVREQEAQLADARAAKQQEQQRLREEEFRLKIEGMSETIGELQRRAQDGSHQARGEAQEVLLRDILREAFETDTLDDVAVGAHGADVLQRVRGRDGRDCGLIVWESKRTKAWSDAWLAKLRDDQRDAGAALAVVVTQALPDDVGHFALKDGVWVCGWSYAVALGAALRGGLIEVALARRVAEGRGEKMQMLYDYLTGTEFRNRVAGLVEAFIDMNDDLEREKRATLTSWRRRALTIERARANLTAFYGDFQGIAGRQLADLPALALEVADSPDAPDSAPPESGGDPRLKELLYNLIPVDGSPVGNGSLVERLVDQALVELGVQATADDYEQAKRVLLAEGRIRRGRGRGGSVYRAPVGAAE